MTAMKSVGTYLAIFAAAFAVAALAVLAGRAVSAPSSLPTHFGTCPAGQHWEQAPGNGDFGWECVR